MEQNWREGTQRFLKRGDKLGQGVGTLEAGTPLRAMNIYIYIYNMYIYNMYIYIIYIYIYIYIIFLYTCNIYIIYIICMYIVEFSCCGFKCHSCQLSIAILKNLSVVNAYIYIS